jgi:hypothetical protein
MTAGSVTSAMTRSRPPQYGQRVCYLRAFDLYEQIMAAAYNTGPRAIDRVLASLHLNIQAQAGALSPMMQFPRVAAQQTDASVPNPVLVRGDDRFGDHLVVEAGVPNYIMTPTGAIRVLERVDGQYRVRAVRDDDARHQDRWRPGRCDRRGGR